MFLGRYEHTIDSKGRVAVPAKFRHGLSDGMVITRWVDKCLTLYPSAYFEALAQKVSSLPVTDPNARNLRRIFFSDASNCDIDKQGRIVIASDLRNYADMGSDEALIIFAGVNDYIEIWNKENWLAVKQKAEENSDSIVSALNVFGIL